VIRRGRNRGKVQGKRYKGEGRREKGEGRREKGEGRREIEDYEKTYPTSTICCLMNFSMDLTTSVLYGGGLLAIQTVKL